jgi:hypothetical protein
MPLKITKALMKKSKEKAMKTMKAMSPEPSRYNTDEFGCFVVNLAGKRLFHCECPNGSDEMVGYLDFWVRSTGIPGLAADRQVVLTYGDQILSHTARFRDYGIPDGATVKVVIQ